MSLAAAMSMDSFWTDKWRCDDAQKMFYENKSGMTSSAAITASPVAAATSAVAPPSSLVSQVAAARQKIQQSLQSDCMAVVTSGGDADVAARIEGLARENRELRKVTENLQAAVSKLERRVATLEGGSSNTLQVAPPAAAAASADEDEDDFELFGDDDDDEEDAEAERLKEERIKMYEAKKANKKQVIAKSNVILDIKPWDDETDMAAMETQVRTIEMDGLLWGAAKLVPLAYGIKKLQISTVIEDDKVSVDELEELITAFEDYVQSVDIAAFNKI